MMTERPREFMGMNGLVSFKRSSGILNWTSATKAALAKPEVRMGVLLMLPFFAMELPRSDLMRLEYVLGELK